MRSIRGSQSDGNESEDEVLLPNYIFDEVGRFLRENGGSARQRQLQVDVTLATASGNRIEACIQQFARGGIALTTATAMHRGDRFGFKIPTTEGTHFLFCEVLGCRLVVRGFEITASFLAQEMRCDHDRQELKDPHIGRRLEATAARLAQSNDSANDSSGRQSEPQSARD